MSSIPNDVLRDLAPTGRLRVAINFGNPVLAQRQQGSDEPQGVSVDLARALAEELGVDITFITFESAGKVFDAVAQWDVAFLARDPVRAAGIAFTSPYVVIEGTYLVRDESPLRSVDDADQAGVRIAVGEGAAYDLYLTRALKHAELVRAATSAAAIELFVAHGLDAAAGVRQPLEAAAQTQPGLRVIPGRFTAIEQAMGTPLGRDAGAAYLQTFVEARKASGFVAEGLRRSGQHAAAVAPPAA